MPRVGSLAMNTLGGNTTQRAMATFCWLPPLKFPTGRRGLLGRTPTLSMACWATVTSWFPERMKPVMRFKWAREMF